MGTTVKTIAVTGIVAACIILYALFGRLTSVWWAERNDVYICGSEVIPRHFSDGTPARPATVKTCMGEMAVTAGFLWPLFVPIKVAITIADRIIESITND